MRQAGSLAAAGIYALDHHIQRLAEDHANAVLLATGLSEIDSITVDTPQTNVVYANIAPAHCDALSAWLRSRGIVARVSPRMRMLTHLDISRDDVSEVISAFTTFFDAPNH